MLCKRCMVVMSAGTRYEREGDKNQPSHKRYFECGKCHDRVYTNVPNFQELLVKESEKKQK